MSLAKAKLEKNDRNNKLKSFITGIVDTNHSHFIAGIVSTNYSRHITEINKIIEKTGHKDLLLKNEIDLIVDIEAVKNLNINDINSHIEKCNNKIINKDYTGAVTNARSLLEVIYLKIIYENNDDIEIFKGDLNKMYSAVKAIIQKNVNNNPSNLIQMLGGFASITNSIASFSNSPLSDRYGHLLQDNNKRYAELIVNLTFSISYFFISLKW